MRLPHVQLHLGRFARHEVAFRAFEELLIRMFVPHVRAQVLGQGSRVFAALFDDRTDEDRSFRVKSSVTAQGVWVLECLGAIFAVELRRVGLVQKLVSGEFVFSRRLVFAVFVVASKNEAALLLPTHVSAVTPQMILVLSFALRRPITDRAEVFLWIRKEMGRRWLSVWWHNETNETNPWISFLPNELLQFPFDLFLLWQEHYMNSSPWRTLLSLTLVELSTIKSFLCARTCFLIWRWFSATKSHLEQLRLLVPPFLSLSQFSQDWESYYLYIRCLHYLWSVCIIALSMNCLYYCTTNEVSASLHYQWIVYIIALPMNCLHHCTTNELSISLHYQWIVNIIVCINAQRTYLDAPLYTSLSASMPKEPTYAPLSTSLSAWLPKRKEPTYAPFWDGLWDAWSFLRRIRSPSMQCTCAPPCERESRRVAAIWPVMAQCTRTRCTGVPLRALSSASPTFPQSRTRSRTLRTPW